MRNSICEIDADVGAAHFALGPWSCLGTTPGEVTHPDQLRGRGCEWLPAAVPGTVASALNRAGRWDFRHPTDLDASDWWFRTTFSALDPAEDQHCRLCFDGLATLGEVWLNGQRVLTTDNMFRAYRLDISKWLEPTNELILGFRSLNEELKRKRPRPRWKTNLVRNQQLRWHRTSLVGRIPGWAPCAPAIGPWRDVRLEASPLLCDEIKIVPTLVDNMGVVTVRTLVRAFCEPQRAVLRIGDSETSLDLQPSAAGWVLAGDLRLPNVPLWWPHTHGTPTLLECTLFVDANGERFEFPCSPVGFRKLEVQTDDGFAVRVNDEPIYCRGACWTVSDLLSPASDEASLQRDLQLAKDAGANILRVGGTMSYESDTFYRLCDELGLIVWQDFMFANMDYPVDDPQFHENITHEAVEQLTRLTRHPSVAIYCGNSEIEQQAAMLGLPRERWSNEWFSRQLPALCAAHHPGTAYVPSTPTGGALPFHTDTGITHYYGIGAYLRSPRELRQADVKFTPECLGFANIPEPSTVYAVTGGGHPVTHDPVWKQRVPRDGGAGWDFEDVRDHYLREVYGVEPAQLRSFDMPRYMQLSRIVSGEMMATAFSEWRSTHSRNQGGLVWFFKDLWPGAGWGIVDSNGLPKAAYYYLKRCWNTRQLTLTDEGLNGLHLHLTNETATPVSGTVELVLLKEPQVVIARQEVGVQLGPRSRWMLSGDEIIGRFCDTTYAYRFGPPQHDVVVATWFDEKRCVISEAFHFVRRSQSAQATPQHVVASAESTWDGGYCVTICSERFLHAVRLHADGYLPEDNYFHLPPHWTKKVMFRAVGTERQPFRLSLTALNLDADVSVSPNSAN